MFDELKRMLSTLDGKQISIPNPTRPDEDGYFDKECPNTQCQFVFKIFADDWRDIVRDEEVFCPLCGHSAPAKSWFTTEQVEWVNKAALNHVERQLGDAMRKDAEAWNRRQKPGSFISITMQVKDRPEPVHLPLAVTEPMRLRITCRQCNCRYSVIGSAYFCPSCGHNAADSVFNQSLDKIRAWLDIAPTLRATILDKDTAENTVRALTEGGLQSAVTSFQRFMEALYDEDPTRPRARRNAFQNLDEGSQLWLRAVGGGYDQHITATELGTLSRYLQMRHLLAHRDGLVDAEFISKTGDVTYREGQRVVIQIGTVKECIDLIERLGKGVQTTALQTRPALPKQPP